jgi:DNA-binding PadR family transcriptional regulator
MPDELSRSGFVVLLSLADRPRHGLGVIEDIEARTGGEVKLGPGTLYGTIKRLVGRGYIRETEDAPDPSDDDPRRRYYEVTPEGRRVVADEAARLRTLVEIADAKELLEVTAE